MHARLGIDSHQTLQGHRKLREAPAQQRCLYASRLSARGLSFTVCIDRRIDWLGQQDRGYKYFSHFVWIKRPCLGLTFFA